jgi:hypothetical protein
MGDEMAGQKNMHGWIRNAYKIMDGKPEVKRPLGRPRYRWDNNNKMDLKKIYLEGVD